MHKMDAFFQGISSKYAKSDFLHLIAVLIFRYIPETKRGKLTGICFRPDGEEIAISRSLNEVLTFYFKV